MVRISRQRLIEMLPRWDVARWGGAAAALLTAAFFLLLPDWRLETAVSASGLPLVLPFAQPPLGLTARALLVLAGAGLAGAIAWSALFLLWGPGGPFHRPRSADAPSVRRADAHPDAPPRWPLSAADLGVPPPPSVQPIPVDLDQPLAAFHPAAIPDTPLEPVRPVPSVVAWPRPEPVPMPVLAAEAMPALPTEREIRRIETFELTPMVRPPAPPPAPEVGPSIDALLERLERGTRRRSGASA